MEFYDEISEGLVYKKISKKQRLENFFLTFCISLNDIMQILIAILQYYIHTIYNTNKQIYNILFMDQI